MSLKVKVAGWWTELPRWKRTVVLVVAWFAAGLYVVGPDQVALVRIGGRFTGEVVPAGVWWRPAWPVGRVDRVRLARPRLVTIGAAEGLNLVGQEAAGQAELLTGDQNLVRVRAVVQYTITEPRLYLYGIEAVDQVVAAAVEAHLTATAASIPVDELMTTGQREASRATLAAAQASLDRYGVGVRLTGLQDGAVNLLQQVQPPPEARQAFDDVSSARQNYNQLIDEARGYANEIIPRARGEAAELSSRAEGYKVKVVNEARGRADRFRQQAAEYRRAPGVTRTRLHLETLERIAPRLKTTVVDADDGRRPIDLGVIAAPPTGATP